MASHTTLMNTKWDEVDHLDRAHDFRNALWAARDLIEGSGADTAVVVGPNHFRGFWLDLMPAFTVGVGEVIGAGEHGTPPGPQPTHAPLARQILNRLNADDIDAAFSLRLTVDHGVTHAIQYVLPNGMPVVPIIINGFAPPLPSLARCAAVGESLAEAIASDGEDRRVVVIGSGGLSHRLPFPDWRDPQSDDDEYLVESWLEGRTKWEDYEGRRRRIIVAAPPEINEEFDRAVLAALAAGEGRRLLDHQTDLAERAGNGANEIRNWIATSAACGWAPARTLCYSPMPEWLTGMGVATTLDPLPEEKSP